MLDLFQGTVGQSLLSGDLSLSAFFSSPFTSEASPQVVASITVTMATDNRKL